jgi:hypothetical protein
MTEKNSTSPGSGFSLRVLIDYIMGGIIGSLGLFFLIRAQFPSLPMNKYLGEPDALDWLFGGLCIAYAGWRVFRGRRKSKEA